MVVDSTLGPSSVLAGPHYKIPASLGKTVGDNLFHSFSEFSIQTGQTASFSGPEQIHNILGRVTGGSISLVDGLIKSDIPESNLYLLNPNGFIFGQNAKVDVDGAFVVSARDRIKLGDKGGFDAVNPEKSTLISASPEAFGFLGGNPAGNITFDGAKIIASKQKSGIGVSGKVIQLKNSAMLANEQGGSIRIEGEEIRLFSGSEVSADTRDHQNGGNISMDASSITLSESRLSSSTYYGGVEGAEGEGGSGGNISIKAEQLDVGKYGELLVETLGSGDGGALRLEVDRMKVSGKGARLSGQSGYKYKSQEWKSHEKATGRGGSIEIDAKTMEVSQRGEISVQTTGHGEGGSLDLRVTEVLEVTGLRPKISANTYEAKGGSITMELGGLKVTGANASIESNTRGVGMGGSIKIEGEGALFEIGKGGSVVANTEGSGAGGSILMKGGGLALVGGRIESNTEGAGSGGLIELRLTDSIEIEGIQSNRPDRQVLNGHEGMITSQSIAEGSGGRIKIEANKLLSRAGAAILADARGEGDGGSIEIKVGELDMDGSAVGHSSWNGSFLFKDLPQIRATTVSSGKGGVIEIDAGKINLEKGAVIAADTQAGGDAGSITINTEEMYLFGEHSRISSSVSGQQGYNTSYATGTGGSINVKAKTIELKGRGGIFVETKPSGEGDAGSILLETDKLLLEGGGRILGSSSTKGDAGEVRLRVNELEMKDGHIGSQANSTGAAGSVIVDGVGEESEFRLEKGEVTTSSVKGVKPAGSIEISADRVILGDVEVKSDSKSDGGSGTLILDGRDSLEIGPESEVTSVTEGSGPGGSVNLKGDRVEIVGGLVATDTRSENEGAGDAGRIEVRANEFNILDGGRMSSVSEGRGGAGVVGVEAKSFRLSGSSTDKTSRVSSSTYYGGVEGAEGEGGSGGNISIKAEQLDVGKYGELLVETLGSGDGGALRLEVDRMKVSGKGARLSGQSGYKYKSQEWKSHEKATGRGGSIEIDAKTMEVSQRGEISVQTTGHGEGGSLDLRVTEVLEVTGLRPKISANTYEAKGGSITMELGGLKVTGANASIESNTRGVGMGGSIKIEGEGALFEIGKGGSVVANTEGSGAGGSILMKGGGLALVGGRIESNTEGAGSGGLIELRLTDSIEIEGIQSNRPDRQVLNGHEGMITSQSIAEGSGGRIKIEANKLLSRAGAAILADARGEGDGGSIEIKVGELDMDGSAVGHSSWNGSFLFKDLPQIRATTVSSGKGGVIEIDAGKINLEKGAVIAADTQAGGDAGSITINTEEMYLFGEHSRISSSVSGQQGYNTSYATGTGGSINVKAKTIELKGRGGIFVETKPSGEGDAGSILLETDKLLLEGGGRILGSSSTKGDAGEVRLRVNELEMKDGHIGSQANSTGAAGSVIVDGVGEESEFRLEKGEVTTSSVKGVKPAGSIEISADRVILGDVEVKSDSKSDGGSGTLILDGRDSLEIGPESEVTSVTEGSGPGGSVNLKGDRVEIVGGLVATDTRSENEGAGDAGRIEVRANEFNILDGGRMSSVSEGRGDAGKIELFLEEFILREGGKVSVESAFTNGGDVLVYSNGNIWMDRGGLIASAGDNGGSILFRGAASIYLRDSLLSAEAGIDGGNIELRTPLKFVSQRSVLVANAIHGNGGNISVSTEGYLSSLESQVSASSEFGLEGSIVIDTPQTDVGSGLIVLPDGLMDINANIAERCSLRLSSNVSSFFIRGAGGLSFYCSETYVPSLIVDIWQEEQPEE